jgi:uncharacterized protein (TIGR03437 family)
LGSAGSYTVAVYGQPFAPGDTLSWNGSALTTTFVGPAQLTASVPASLVLAADNYLLTESSNGVSANCVLVGMMAPAGSIASVTPSQADAGGPAFSATLLGSGFTAGSQVFWGGTPVSTVFAGPGQLAASIPAAAIATSGVYPVTVMNPGGAVSNAVPFYAQPVLASISPNFGMAGSAGIAVTATGTGFAPGDVLAVNRSGVQSNLPTAFLGPTGLSATIPASALAASGLAGLFVSDGNPASGIASRALPFRIGSAPMIDSLNPAMCDAGGPAFSLSVNGGGFVAGAPGAPGSVVGWNGSPLPTTFDSDTQLTASVPASLIATPATASVTVAYPGGSVSQALSFVATPPGLSISALAPASATAGGPAFTLAITGAGFSSGASVLWNGTGLPTTVIGSAQLIAAVPAGMIAASGRVSITVAVSAGVSNALIFRIVPPAPVATADGIVNAFSSTASLAPGSLISIQGSNLAASIGAPAAPALTQDAIGTTSVAVNGVAAPLLYVSPSLISAQMPFETAPGAASLVVDVAGVRSVPAAIQVTGAAPGVAVTGASHAVAVNYPDGSVNSAANPAQPGQYVIVYLTGQGALDNPVATGAPAPSSPFSRPTALVLARVGGLPAQISFSGMVPGWVGVLQMNLMVPQVPSGEQPLEVSIGGVSANSTVLSIAANAAN